MWNHGVLRRYVGYFIDVVKLFILLLHNFLNIAVFIRTNAKSCDVGLTSSFLQYGILWIAGDHVCHIWPRSWLCSKVKGMVVNPRFTVWISVIPDYCTIGDISISGSSGHTAISGCQSKSVAEVDFLGFSYKKTCIVFQSKRQGLFILRITRVYKNWRAIWGLI